MTEGSIIILGANPSSEALIKQLLKLDYTVSVIDDHAADLKRLEEKYDLVTILGHPSHPNLLDAALDNHSNFLIAMTAYDETNLLACQTASDIANIHTICCIQDTRYILQTEQDNSAPRIDNLIPTNQSVVQEFQGLVNFPEFFHINKVSESHIAVSMHINDEHPYIGKTLEELPKHLPPKCIIAGLYRSGGWIAYRGNIKITKSDIALMIIHESQLASLAQEKKAKSITVLGAGPVCQALTAILADEFEITVIDQNVDRCQDLASSQPEVTVIHADPQDLKTIEPYVSRGQTVLSLSPDDENNLVYAFGALDAGAKHTFNLVNHIRESHIFASSPIKHIISKPQIISDHVFRDLLSKQSINYFYTKPNFMQMATVYIGDQHPYIDQRLLDLELDEQIVIGCIFRDQEPLFTTKQQVVKKGDQLLLYAPHDAGQINPLEQVFGHAQALKNKWKS